MHVPRALLLVLLLSLPALGAAATTAPGAADTAGPVVIPLGGPTPASYTAEVHARTLRAAERGMAYDAENDREVAFAPHVAFIRPGASMWSPSWCTLGFVVGTPGAYKMVTAGHCAGVGEDVVILAYPGVFANVGRVSVSHDNGVGDDYALIEVRGAMQQHVDANVACIGGPRGGAYAGDGSDVLHVKYVGASAPCVPRAGRLTGLTATTFSCACPIGSGDSGAPVLAVTAENPVGYALGFVTHMVVGPTGSTAVGMRMSGLSYPVRDGDLDPRPPA